MKLKKDGPLARFYAWTYCHGQEREWDRKRELPTKFCPFFWELMFAIAILPITWMSALTDREEVCQKLGARLTVGMLAYAALIILCAIVALVYNFPWIVLTVLGGALGIAAIGGLGTYFFTQSRTWRAVGGSVRCAVGSTFEAIGEVVEVASTKKESFTNNYCPKIDWE